MAKFLELILIVLIVRALVPVVAPLFQPPHPRQQPPRDADLYKQKADIVDGEFEEVKK